MGSKQTIELNGKHYDARTGKILSVNAQPAPSARPVRTVNTLVRSGTSIDGFSKKQSHPPRKVSQQQAHRQAHKSQTLKRSAVKKPAAAKRSAAASTAIAPAAHTPVMEMHPPSYSIPQERLKRLQTIKQSAQISRYKNVAAIQVPHHRAKKAPAHHAPHAVVKAVSTVVDAPATQEDTFQQAVENATAHATTKSRKPSTRARLARKLRVSPRTLNATGFIVAAMLFAGYFGYNSAPNLSMRVASMRADVPGSIPAYKPSGFSLDRDIAYKQGQITVSFVSNSDERKFEITQTASGWDSNALHQNFVAAQEHVRTIEDKGKKIFLYDDNNATWVDGGVWYKIEGNSKLNSEQLSRIASSL